MSWLALFLALAFAGSHLLLDFLTNGGFAETPSDAPKDWAILEACGRLALAVMPNLVAVLVVYAFVARVLRARGLDSATQLAERVRSEIQQMAGTTHAPLEVLLDQVDPSRFRWDDDFLSKARGATLICRFGEDFFEHWYRDFLEFLNANGRIILVLPNPYRPDLLQAMDSQRGDRNVLRRIERTLTVVDRIVADSQFENPVSIKYVDRILSYDIYLAPGSIAIQAPYENFYLVGNRPPVSIASSGSDLYQFLEAEAVSLVEAAVDRETVEASQQHPQNPSSNV